MSRLMITIAGGMTIALALSGCGNPAGYQERMNYLHTLAQRGADTHALLASQLAPKIDAKRCKDAYAGLQDSTAPADLTMGEVSEGWRSQMETFFVDSCVSGLPKPVPGASTAPPSAPSPASGPSALRPTP